MARAVIATIGEDRPGLVNELSAAVLTAGLNVEDSRMTVLGGEFAVLMSVAGGESELESLQGELAMLSERLGLAHLFRRTSERPTPNAEVYLVSVEAVDHPGIVHGIASFFSDRGINIRELETETRPAAHTGAPVFNVRMEIEVPDSVPVGALRKGFEAYCSDESLDGDMISP